MKKVIMLYALLLVTVTGCIKENLDDCETILYFDYLGDGTRDIFLQKIEKVDMYIYNEDHVCIQKTALDKSGRFNVTLALPIVSNFPQKASLAAINASFVRSNDAVLYPTTLKSAVLYTLLAAPLSGTYSAQNNAFDTSFCSSTEIVKDTLPSVTGLVT